MANVISLVGRARRRPRSGEGSEDVRTLSLFAESIEVAAALGPGRAEEHARAMGRIQAVAIVIALGRGAAANRYGAALVGSVREHLGI